MIETVEMGRSRGSGQQIAEMLPLLVRHEIQVLRKAGFSARDVAGRVGVSVDSVRRVDREDGVTHVDDRAERKARRVGRPSTAAPFTEKVQGWLKSEPELPTMELLRRAKQHGYTGSKTAYCALVAGLRPPKAAPIVRFEGLPGEFSQHEFGSVAGLVCKLQGITVFEKDAPTAFDRAAASRAMAAEDVLLELHLTERAGSGVVLTSDLGYRYVEVNAEYTT